MQIARIILQLLLVLTCAETGAMPASAEIDLKTTPVSPWYVTCAECYQVSSDWGFLVSSQSPRLPGHIHDPDIGLHYNDRRYYDADTGRYQTRDPIGFEGGINLYSYAAASPTRFTDPTGEIIPCMAANFARCMVVCGLQSVAMNAASGECIDIGNIAKDCAVDCLLSMLPIPDPCGRFGKLFSAAVGIGSGLANSFEQDTLVHTRILTDSGYQTKLKAIKDIQVGDEVLAWDELQAHDNAAMAQSGQAAQTLQAAHSQADSQNTANSGIKSASSPSNQSASSYQNKSVSPAYCLLLHG